MGQEYSVECNIETDNESLANEFIAFIKEHREELGVYGDITPDFFKYSTYRGVDYSLIENKLKELHSNNPDAFFVFTTGVVTICDDLGFQYDFGMEELPIQQKYVYTNEDGEKVYDYCESCNRPVKQEDLGDGSFGCEFCKSGNQISIMKYEE